MRLSWKFSSEYYLWNYSMAYLFAPYTDVSRTKLYGKASIYNKISK